MEHEQELREVENQWKSRLSDVTSNLEAVKEQLEKDAQQKMESLVEQHRLELGKQLNPLKRISAIIESLLYRFSVGKFKTPKVRSS